VRINLETRRDLELLEAVAVDQKITQRNLSSRLGIALGLTNLCVKRLVRKGFIKCVNVNPTRVLYLITPQGIAEKTRLTYLFVNDSLQLYREVRIHLRKTLEPIARNNVRIAIYGTGEAAEMAYLSLKELGIEPVAIYSGHGKGSFLGITVRVLEPSASAEFDYLLLASLEKPAGLAPDPVFRGISKEKLLVLHPATAGNISNLYIKERGA
jgi:hypothetical protein